MKISVFMTILFLSFIFINCEGNLTPSSKDLEKIIPLKLNNEWEFENVSTGGITAMSVNKMSTINNQKFYILENPEYIFGYENLFYRDNSLFTFDRDSNEILLIKDNSLYQSFVFQGRHMFEEEERLEVPAGVFRCFRIMQRIGYGFNTHTTTIWFSYGFGPIMKTFSHQYQTQTISSYKYVLKSYKLH